MKLTIVEVRKQLAAIGITLLRTSEGEFEVKRRGELSGNGYFTNDLADALSTGLAIAARSN